MRQVRRKSKVEDTVNNKSDEDATASSQDECNDPDSNRRTGSTERENLTEEESEVSSDKATDTRNRHSTDIKKNGDDDASLKASLENESTSNERKHSSRRSTGTTKKDTKVEELGDEADSGSAKKKQNKKTSKDRSDVAKQESSDEKEVRNDGSEPEKKVRRTSRVPTRYIKEGTDEDAEYEVERIIKQRQKANGSKEFLVRWKGHTKIDDSWEPEKNLNCSKLINAFVRNEEEQEKKAKIKEKEKRKRKSSGEDETEYEVKEIIKVRNKKGGKREFLVRWKGYSKSDDSWEPEEHLNCPKLIAKFEGKS